MEIAPQAPSANRKAPVPVVSGYCMLSAAKVSKRLVEFVDHRCQD